jgi:hypothetical protein
MNNRLIAPFRKPNSSFYWFRLVIPERYRQAVGKREILAFLKTRDTICDPPPFSPPVSDVCRPNPS